MNAQGLRTVKGYVISVPRDGDIHQAHVAIQQDDEEYRILPRGTGVDLNESVGLLVEARGTVEQQDDLYYLQVRKYTILEDDSWLEDA
ncbi:MAG: hypothetical protein PHN64_00660 [Desulfovibrionaceae bacterium]|nr:hypothetical protein [Desulfovibrionaceae bacterium]